ncbi:MAG: polysaccharide biosynthesis/export family protein [Phycisphaerae bacterium]|nr:polysaccharide biosynthesis/export family protein [Phycisphaerae bacterium]
MTKTDRRRLLLTVVVMVFGLTGCSKDHLDPTQIGRFRSAPAVNVILDSLGVAEETVASYEGAEDPKPADVIIQEQDYAFSSGDTIRISIFELLQEGQPYVDNYIVSESGNISIPEIGQIQAAGLTETQLEEEIRNSLSPGILKSPSVTISLQNSLSRTFTILGDGVSNPGRYNIPRYDFRLMDALAVAGSARQFNVSYLYVVRRLTGQEQLGEQVGQESPMDLKPVETGKQIDANNAEEKINQEMLEVIEPTFSRADSGGLVIASAEMVTKEQLETLAIPETVGDSNNDNAQHEISSTMPEAQENEGRIEWVFRDGKWVPVKIGEPVAVEPEKQADLKPQFKPQPAKQKETKPVEPETKPLPEQYGWEDIQSAGIQSRVIRIPKDKLYGGDPRYNIVVKPQDTVTVQLDVVGEFYVLGNVNNQGVINLTGRPMTLKMAIAAAGGLGPLAWPKKCEVIRRIGEKKEEMVMVDLEKIANGSQPDFFIKPNDVINVGTHGIARYLAVLRNAFRATYGFGFIYDRNFSNRSLSLDNPEMLLHNW